MQLLSHLPLRDVGVILYYIFKITSRIIILRISCEIAFTLRLHGNCAYSGMTLRNPEFRALSPTNPMRPLLYFAWGANGLPKLDNLYFFRQTLQHLFGALGKFHGAGRTHLTKIFTESPAPAGWSLCKLQGPVFKSLWARFDIRSGHSGHSWWTSTWIKCDIWTNLSFNS